MADTALDLIVDALLDLGVLADEETPTASQAAGALRKLNNMIDAWNIENLMVYGSQQYIFPLTANQGVYSIGPTGTLNIPRPAQIQSAFIRDVNASAPYRADIPLYIYNDQEWQDVTFKGQTESYPLGIWFNNTSPLIYAYLNPVPSTTQYSVVFWAAGQLANLNLTDVINFAPGYKRALSSNLAIELAASYQVEPPGSVVSIAQKSKSWLQVNNLQINEMNLPVGLDHPWFDIRTGWYR